MEVKIAESWEKRLVGEFEKDYFKELMRFVKSEYRNHQAFPDTKNIYAAFDACSFDDTKVVILGQDPYHGDGQANGLCFSVPKDIKIPPSLRNIYKELKEDISSDIPNHGDLSNWARQGILMLNATLTVRASEPGSHQNKGWEQFTDAVIQLINDEKENIVFLLWGAYAQKKGSIIDTNRHHVLSSAHPSPFSAYRGFLGNKHFSKTNELLVRSGLKEINWLDLP